MSKRTVKAKTKPRTQAPGSAASHFTEEIESMSKDLTQYVTTKQAAELLGVDRTHVNHLLREGRLKGIKPGHDWLVFAPSLSKYVETKDSKGRPPARAVKIAVQSE